MSWQVIIEKPAQLDIDEAFAWYEGQSIGLGFRFIQHLDETIEAVIRNPYFAFAVVKSVRSTSLSVFPYEVIYLIDEPKQTVFVLAVGHLYRKPGWFRQRLK